MVYQVQDWRRDLAVHHSSDWKEFFYRFARPALHLYGRTLLSRRTLDQLRPSQVLFRRGMPLVARRRWGAGGPDLRGKRLLVLGTGNGWDVASWAQLGPDRIDGVDLFPFASWPEVRAEVEKLGVACEFHVSPVDRLDFLADESVDMIASDAVYEHIADLPKAMAESRRVLRPGGTLYATYGPLWYSAGGDHFSGRGGLETCFNHVLLAGIDYKRYFEAQRLEVEDFQSGGRYVELDLFSKLRTAEYIAIFDRAGFSRESLVLEVSDSALAFSRRFPDLFSALHKLHSQCDRDDFLISGNFVRLRRD